MITVGMNYRVLPGKEETFENAFRAVLNAMIAIPGHKESHLYRDVDDPAGYLIVSEWENREAFDGFTGSDQFRKVANWGKEQILAGRPRHEIYEKPDVR
jgi:heme-degrading monooxygenase HmoA